MNPPRRLLVIADEPCPPALLEQMQMREWEPLIVATGAAAREALQAQQTLLALVIAGHVTPALCETVRTCARSAPHCEWVGVFPAPAVQEPAARALVLEYMFDYHTQPVDPTFLCRLLGHAFGRALLRAVGGDAGMRFRAGVEDGNLQKVREQAEKAAVVHALARANENVTVAARELDVSRMTLYRLVAKHGIPLRAT